MRDAIYTTVRQLISGFGQQEMWAIYQLELTPNLERVTSKSLDVIEYHTVDVDGEPFVLALDVTEAMDLLANLKAVLEVTR